MLTRSDIAGIYGMLLLILSHTSPYRSAHPYLTLATDLTAGYFFIKALFLSFKGD